LIPDLIIASFCTSLVSVTSEGRVTLTLLQLFFRPRRTLEDDVLRRWLAWTWWAFWGLVTIIVLPRRGEHAEMIRDRS
jgi:hypothetical protein